MRGKFSFKLPRLYSIAFILMNFLLWTQRPGQKANSGIGKLQNHRQIVDSESNAISPNSTRILLKHKNQQEILNSSHDSKSLLRFRISVEQGNNSWPPQPNEAHTLTQGSANQTTIVNRSDNRIRQEFRFQKDQQIPPMPLHSNTPNLVWTYELEGKSSIWSRSILTWLWKQASNTLKGIAIALLVSRLRPLRRRLEWTRAPRCLDVSAESGSGVRVL